MHESSIANDSFNRSNIEKLRTCDVLVVTYYWSEAAEGGHLITNLFLIPSLIILGVIGSILNSLLIIAYAKNSRLRSLPSMMLITIASSDVLISTLVEPLFAARLIMEVLGTPYCPLWTTCRLVTYFSCGVSLLTIAIMSIERFITLAYPYRHHVILTPTRLKIIVIATWLTLFALVVSNLRIVPQSILLLIGAVLNLFSLAVVIGIWVWIHRLLRKHKNTIWTMQTPSDEPCRNRKKVFRNTKTTYIVVASVLLCYFPALLLMGYFALSESVGFVAAFLVDPWLETLMFSNAVINPLLVLYRNRDFRECTRAHLPGCMAFYCH